MTDDTTTAQPTDVDEDLILEVTDITADTAGDYRALVSEALDDDLAATYLDLADRLEAGTLFSFSLAVLRVTAHESEVLAIGSTELDYRVPEGDYRVSEAPLALLDAVTLLG